jgi:hypothetical protein
MISIIESIALAESESRSNKWGIKLHAANGTSKLYNRKCYGYVNANDGTLIIEESKAKIVKMIFNMYFQDKNVIGIVSELERRKAEPGDKPGVMNETIYQGAIDNLFEKYI